MLIIKGAKDITDTIVEMKQPDLCMNCNNHVRHKVLKKTTFFTLFFIPILPVYARYTVYCPICTFERKITRTQANAYYKEEKV